MFDFLHEIRGIEKQLVMHINQLFKRLYGSILGGPRHLQFYLVTLLRFRQLEINMGNQGVSAYMDLVVSPQSSQSNHREYLHEIANESEPQFLDVKNGKEVETGLLSWDSCWGYFVGSWA